MGETEKQEKSGKGDASREIWEEENRASSTHSTSCREDASLAPAARFLKAVVTTTTTTMASASATAAVVAVVVVVVKTRRWRHVPARRNSSS